MRIRRLPLIAVAMALLAVPGLPAQAEAPGDAFPDVTAPVIFVDAPAGAWEGWYSHPVEVKIRSLDEGVGVDSLIWTLAGAQTASGSANPSTVLVNKPGVSTFDVRSTDFEGNSSTARYGVGIDPFAPLVTLGGTAVNGMVVAKGDQRTLTYTCGDDLTGVRLCTGDVASGAHVPTATVGQKTVEVWGIDKVDNRTTRAITYTVLDTMQVTAVPTITGTRRAGFTLTAGGAAFNPAPANTAYVWARDGIAIATGSTYTLTHADIGRTIAVYAKGFRTGYADAVTNPVNAGPIFAELFQVAGEPVLQGVPAVGRTLTLVPPNFVPTPATTQYTWRRDGNPIPGAWGSTYVLTPDDAGARIVASVLINRPGFQETLLSTPSTAPVQASELALARPAKLIGSTRVGQTLRATAPVFEPAATAVTYQWLRDGSVIPGAVAASYKIAAADVGRRITVRVVGTRAQYVATTSEATTAKVVKAMPSLGASARARGKKKVRIVVAATAAGVVPTGRVTIKRGSKVVATRTLTNGRATIDLARQKKGKAAYTVVYSGSGSVETRSVRTRTVRIR